MQVLVLVLLTRVSCVFSAPLAPQRHNSHLVNSQERYSSLRPLQKGYTRNPDDSQYHAPTLVRDVGNTTHGTVDGCRVFQQDGMCCRECTTNKGGVYEREIRCTRLDKASSYVCMDPRVPSAWLALPEETTPITQMCVAFYERQTLPDRLVALHAPHTANVFTLLERDMCKRGPTAPESGEPINEYVQQVKYTDIQAQKRKARPVLTPESSCELIRTKRPPCKFPNHRS